MKNRRGLISEGMSQAFREAMECISQTSTILHAGFNRGVPRELMQLRAAFIRSYYWAPDPSCT